MQPEKTKTRLEELGEHGWFWFVFFALTIFVYFFGLTIPLVGPDEPRYAQVAREMFERGDWVTPTLGGFNWFEKPALLYWLEIVSYHILGVNEFAARFGPALFGLGTVLSMWMIGRYASGSRRIANWLAMLTASTLGIIVFSRGASFDIILTFPITASLAGFIIYELNENNPRIAFATFYFFIGVALLAKGLIGLVFPFAIVGLFYLFVRRWPRRDLIYSLVWGVPLFLAVAATWYLPMYLRHGYTFIDEFIIQQHFQRFTSNKYQHPQPFIFFFWVLPLMTLPWMPLFLLAIWQKIKHLFRRTRGQIETINAGPIRADLEVFALAWLIVPLAFFSFSGSKLPGYILPAVPSALMLSCYQILRIIQKRPVVANWVKGLAVSTFVVIAAVIIFFVPRFANAETDKKLFETANAKGLSQLKVTGLFIVSHNAEFYAPGRLIRDADGKQHKFYSVHEIRDYIESNGREPLLVLLPHDYVRQLTANDIVKSQVLEENGELAIAVVELK